MNFLVNIDTYLIPVINIKNSLVKNWDDIMFPSLSTLFPYVPAHNE